MKKIENIKYGEASEAQMLDLFLPEGDVKAVFVYFHGGGLIEGDKSVGDIFAPYLTDRGVAVISANYRMYPEAKFPDYIVDAASVVAWAKNNPLKEHNCKRLYVGGSSAGGYISMMLCYDTKYLGAVGVDNADISGYFHDAGQPTAHFTVLKNSGYDFRRVIVDETAPLYHIGTSDRYPRCRFVVSDNDIESRYEQTMLLLSTLRHFGHSNFDHIVMHGTHYEYCEKFDELGESILGKLVFDFISKDE